MRFPSGYFSRVSVYKYRCKRRLCLAERADAVGSALGCVNLVDGPLGFRLAMGQAPADAISPLWGRVAPAWGCVAEVLPECKRQALARDMERTLSVARLTPSRPSGMRDRLGFAQSLKLWKFGRSRLAPFPNRKYRRASMGPRPLGDEIGKSPRCWEMR